jgi:cystathionine beta-lyase/cystathionine gamma-synthase
MERPGPATRVIHSGEGKSYQAASLTTPIYETTTFVFDSADDVRQYQEGTSQKFLYSRYGNPTVVATEDVLASIDGAERALVFSSGMGAISTTLLSLLKAGDEVVCASAIYGGTYHLINGVLPGFNIGTRFVTLEALQAPAEVIGDRTRVVWFETPTNPTLRCLGIRAVAAACRARGVISVLDNTFASPINQQPMALGVDLAMQSATKYLNGHSDVTAGVIAGSKALLQGIERTRRMLGTVLDPQPAYALARGLRTLTLRIARHNENAMTVATFLEGHPRVARVFYPGLASHPDRAVAQAQMAGFGGMVTFDLPGGLPQASRVYDRLKVIRRAASLGGVESLASLPVLTSHWGFSDEALARAAVTPGLVRLSVGLEDAADLIEDLAQALEG